MPTFATNEKTTKTFVLNHVIARFSVPQAIITDHGRHFRNIMMTEISNQIGLLHDNSIPSYPQANGQFEACQ